MISKEGESYILIGALQVDGAGDDEDGSDGGGEGMVYQAALSNPLKEPNCRYWAVEVPCYCYWLNLHHKTIRGFCQAQLQLQLQLQLKLRLVLISFHPTIRTSS